MQGSIYTKLNDIKEKYVSEHNEIKPSDAICEILSILEKDVLNSYSVGNVKNNIYGVLKARVESMSNYNRLKPVDNIIIDELISTIYGDKTIDYTMYNFMHENEDVVKNNSKVVTKITYPKVNEMYTLEKEIHIICGKIGITGLIEYTKLLNRYCRD